MWRGEGRLAHGLQRETWAVGIWGRGLNIHADVSYSHAGWGQLGQCIWISAFILFVVGLRHLWKADESCISFFQRNCIQALTGVTQLVGCQTSKWKVTGSIPGQGTCLGCRFDLGWGVCERQPINVSHIDVFFPLFLLPLPSRWE